MPTVNKTDLKMHKDMAAKVLAAKGILYDEWLDQQHQSVIEENAKTIEAALSLLISSKKSGV